MITHNLAIVSEFADQVLVMYGGRVVESGPAEDVLARPLHPYTRGLMKALPRPDTPVDQRLTPIDGVVPHLARMPAGCPFADRCPEVVAQCRAERPVQRPMEAGRTVACILA